MADRRDDRTGEVSYWRLTLELFHAVLVVLVLLVVVRVRAGVELADLVADPALLVRDLFAGSPGG